MAFRTFALHFTVGERGSHRNKIKSRVKQKTVLVFYPKFSCDPSSPNYTEYCRFAMIKYVPWAGKDPNTLWGGQDATKDEIQQAWATHLESFSREGLPVPDFIRREVEEYYSTPENTEPPNLEPDIDTDELELADFATEEININLDEEELTDPDEVDIQWDRDHDWSEPEHDYDESLDLEAVSQQYQNMIDDFVLDVQAAVDEEIPLNELQLLGREMLIDLVEAADVDAGHRLGIFVGRGGTGKSTTINAAVHTLEEKYGVGCVVKFATTGMAATVISGSTVHSSKHGLGIPVGNRKFKKLSGERLKRLQEKFRNVRLIVIDEYSMLRAKELHYIDQYLRQIAGNDLLFGGFAIVLVGDPAQIPAVLGWTLWDKRGGAQEDKLGQAIYEAFFGKVIELLEVKRVEQEQSEGDDEDSNIPSAARYLEILDRIRDGECTEEDWVLVSKVCSRDTMGEAKWNERFGNDDEITYLFTNNRKVDNHNAKMLKRLNNPIALIEAEHTGNSKKMNSSSFMGLQSFLFDIIYEEGKSAPSLPKFVWVDFADQYKGPSYFPNDATRRGWVPVHPFTATEWSYSGASGNKYDEHTRTMLPLKLAWAWTIWKAQGQTMKGKVVAELSSREPEAGITYTAFSRVTRMLNFGIIGGLTFDRFTSKIRNHVKVAGRQLEESRLREIATRTVTYLRHRIASRNSNDG